MKRSKIMLFREQLESAALSFDNIHHFIRDDLQMAPKPAQADSEAKYAASAIRNFLREFTLVKDAQLEYDDLRDSHDALVADNARLREALESIEHHAALILGENSNERETLDAYIDDFDDSIVPPDWATPDKLRAKIGRLKFYVLGEARAALKGIK